MCEGHKFLILASIVLYILVWVRTPVGIFEYVEIQVRNWIWNLPLALR